MNEQHKVEKAWHTAYCRWYDADRAGHPIRAAVWGWLADRICQHLPANSTAGVNDGQGTTFLPDGADDAPDKSKGAAAYPTASRPAPAVNLNEHECVFVEEQEPSGRLILPPCIECGLAAMDALEQLRTRPDARCCPGAGTMAHVRGCVNHPESAR